MRVRHDWHGLSKDRHQDCQHQGMAKKMTSQDVQKQDGLVQKLGGFGIIG